MTNVERRMTKARTTTEFKGRKATASARLRGRRCPACPFCDPAGRCLDATIRSGRCGDWVYYVLPHNKQWRRLWVKPRDLRTSNQLHWRARLGAASRKYNASLTDEQQNACLAAGAKRRSRPRLGQWGWLTGQQFWVSQECATKADAGAQNAERPTKALQTQGISRPTWDTHRRMSVVAPRHHRRDTGRAGKDEGRRKNEEGRRRKPRSASAVKQHQRITGRQFSCFPPFIVRCPPFRVSGAVQPPEVWQRAVVGRERGPPEQDAILR